MNLYHATLAQVNQWTLAVRPCQGNREGYGRYTNICFPRDIIIVLHNFCVVINIFYTEVIKSVKGLITTVKQDSCVIHFLVAKWFEVLLF